jgi:hypothetical protein
VEVMNRRLQLLRFVEGESTFDYMQATKTYIERYGKPVAFYSDKHTVFHVNKRSGVGGNGMTQYAGVRQTHPHASRGSCQSQTLRRHAGVHRLTTEAPARREAQRSVPYSSLPRSREAHPEKKLHCASILIER